MANEINNLLDSIGGVREDWKQDFNATAKADWKVTWAALVAPTNSVAPVITGTAQVGATLTSSTGTFAGGGLRYTYQWTAAGVNIAGATASTFVPTVTQLGAIIAVKVTATNNKSAVTATSANTAAVIAA